MLSLLVVSQTKKLRVRHARNFNRVLKRQEDSLGRAFIRRQLTKIFSLKKHFSSRHFVSRMPSQNFSERGFARTIRPHDGVNFTLLDREINSFKNLVAVN